MACIKLRSDFQQPSKTIHTLNTRWYFESRIFAWTDTITNASKYSTYMELKMQNKRLLYVKKCYNINTKDNIKMKPWYYPFKNYTKLIWTKVFTMSTILDTFLFFSENSHSHSSNHWHKIPCIFLVRPQYWQMIRLFCVCAISAELVRRQSSSI